MSNRAQQPDVLELPEQQHRRKWPPVRTLPCSVTLRGLVVRSHRRTPTELEDRLIGWDHVWVLASGGQAVAYNSDGTPMRVAGRELWLKLRSTRMVRVALRAKNRHLRSAWSSGELTANYVFGTSKKTRRRALAQIIIMNVVCLAVAAVFFGPKLLAVLSMAGQVRFLMLLAIAGLVVCLIVLPCAFFWLAWRASKAMVSGIRVSVDGLELDLQHGIQLHRTWEEIHSLRRRDFVFEAICSDGTKLLIPATGPTKPILEFIQRELYPGSVKADKQSLRNTLIRSCIWFVVGGIIGAGLLYYLQGAGLVSSNGFGPLGAFLAIAIGFPAVLMVGRWLEPLLDPHAREKRRCERQASNLRT